MNKRKELQENKYKNNKSTQMGKQRRVSKQTTTNKCEKKQHYTTHLSFSTVRGS